MAVTNLKAYNMIQPGTEWFAGTITYGSNYKNGICSDIDNDLSMNACTNKLTPVITNIGLPRVGEMFTSQITRRIKVDVDFWTLTPASSTDVFIVSDGGFLPEDASPYNKRGVRPSMYLKSNVVIASDNTGNGTYEKPYSLSLN